MPGREDAGDERTIRGFLSWRPACPAYLVCRRQLTLDEAINTSKICKLVQGLPGQIQHRRPPVSTLC